MVAEEYDDRIGFVARRAECSETLTEDGVGALDGG
jgi:hypothetical protein